MIFVEQLEYITSANTLLQLMVETELICPPIYRSLCHPKQTVFGKPVTVWYNNLFEPCGVHKLVPVQLIKCRSVFLLLITRMLFPVLTFKFLCYIYYVYTIHTDITHNHLHDLQQKYHVVHMH